MTPKVSLRGVTKSFGANTVLRNLSLDVANGEVVSLIGASGSGKTTLLRCVNLLEQIDDGAVLLDGDEISAIGLDPNPVRRRVGIVFQSFNLFPHMSVARNITLALTKVLGQSPADAAAQAGELLRRFGLAEKADVSEELARLLSHCEQFGQALDAQEPVGRKLDFLLQEMNREVNTVGSKAAEHPISSRVVEMKSVLERMREQAANVE